jgi:hypothetical protein
MQGASTLLLAHALQCVEQGTPFILPQAAVYGAINVMSSDAGVLTRGTWRNTPAGQAIQALGAEHYHKHLPDSVPSYKTDTCDSIMRAYLAKGWVTSCENHVVLNFRRRHWLYVQSMLEELIRRCACAHHRFMIEPITNII